MSSGHKGMNHSSPSTEVAATERLFDWHWSYPPFNSQHLQNILINNLNLTCRRIWDVFELQWMRYVTGMNLTVSRTTSFCQFSGVVCRNMACNELPPPLFLPSNTDPCLLFELNISCSDSSVQSTCWHYSVLRFFMRRGACWLFSPLWRGDFILLKVFQKRCSWPDCIDGFTKVPLIPDGS